MTLVALLSTLAVAVTIIQFAPQAIRVHKVGTEGVAVGSWALFTCTTAAWLSYGLREHLWALTLVNLVVGPLSWSILVRLARRGGRTAHLAALAALCAVAWAGLTWVWPTVSVAVLAGVEVLAVVPQTVEVFSSKALSGVSSLTWLATAGAQSLWGFYGIAVGKIAVSAGGFAGGLLAACTAVRLLWVRTRTSRS
jgi:uncharacterized protein with PQ loop repeat